jgi:pyruvate,water dikinase
MAINKVRNQMGLNNITIMIPFIRTIKEASQVISLLEDNGLKRGNNNLEVYMMCEIPSNAIIAEQFLDYFDVDIVRFHLFSSVLILILMTFTP